MTTFDPAFPLVDLVPADYNPRKITPEAFLRLQQSLRMFGVVKPVILNADRTLVAGHQRTKALTAIGATTVPVIVLSQTVNRQEEIQFNLLHNSIETSSQSVTVPAGLPEGYSQVEAGQVTTDTSQSERGRGPRTHSIAGLLRKFGPWGSVVADNRGRVVLNADYAAACHLLGLPVLTYRIADAHLSGLGDFLADDYGEYSYDVLDVKPYHQTLCQMTRKGAAKDRDAGHGSTLYDENVIPALKPGERVFDFGAGKMGYVKRLREQGVLIDGYEPYLRIEGENRFDYPAILDSLRRLYHSLGKAGLFDVVVLDSVLNSVTSLEYEQHVVATCAALTAPNGRFHTGTRNLNHIESRANMRKASGIHRNLEYLDQDDFSVSYRQGAWTLQRFHSPESLRALLSRYFADVTIKGGSRANIWATATQPRPQDPAVLRAALETEFNLPYPDDFRLDRHAPIVQKILALNT